MGFYISLRRGGERAAIDSQRGLISALAELKAKDALQRCPIATWRQQRELLHGQEQSSLRRAVQCKKLMPREP
ncbi:Hypothetical predicted protein [Podarcis lilfordi]|uniref:Uncharacterized protein n=1 Tax=Podarcis lilfordi TaxID=74358 RepID=A0AA35K3X9_9SAUR|nr:Hypothetical predicted protein [Podarcis lilfordi]